MRRKNIKINTTPSVLGILVGGLGNQLFIIFTTINYALEHNKKYLFYNAERKRSVNFENIIYEKNIMNGFKYNEKNDQSYVKIPDKRKIILNGYFQSHKYFHERRKEIFNLIFKNIEIPKNFDEFNTFIHFRIGDYKNYECHPVLPIDYYIKSLTVLSEKKGEENIKLIYFYELEDKDEINTKIMILKNKFPKINFVSVYEINDKLSDIQQILLMSTFENSIIANSTFSWWGAYLNESESKNKNIFYPEKWFSGSLSNLSTKDRFPDEWIKINCI